MRLRLRLLRTQDEALNKDKKTGLPGISERNDWCALSDYFRTFSFDNIQLPEIKQLLFS